MNAIVRYFLHILVFTWAPLVLAGSSPSVSTVFQLGAVGTWFENLAIQSNGTILATRFDTPELWSIDPFTRTGSKLLSFPEFSGLSGICEFSRDLFIIATGNFSVTTGAVAGAMQVLEIDLRGPSIKSRVAARVPDAGLFNGLTKWDHKSVLVADSAKGLIWKVDIETGESSIAISDPTMTIPANASIQVGINGLKVSNSFVYYTSTARQVFCRVPVDSSATPTGPVQVVASGFPQDDFVILPDGTAYVATNSLNTIVKVTTNGSVSTVAGSVGSLELASDTACQFGRTRGDSKLLYVTTAGGRSDPVNGTTLAPAAVMAVDLANCGF